jgi:uncharacterized protein with von Willebrand factor type A (vWA) domain
MLLHEISDPIKGTLDRWAKQYAPKPDKTPEEIAAREQRNLEYKQQQERIAQTVSAIAPKYSGEQFEEFKQEAEETLSPQDLAMTDLNADFNRYNPDRRAAIAKQDWRPYKPDPNSKWSD